MLFQQCQHSPIFLFQFLYVKKKAEHKERFTQVLETQNITIAEYLKVTGVMIHWAEGSRIRRNLVSPLFKTIIRSISPLVMDSEVRECLRYGRMRSAIELIQKKWRGLLQRTPSTTISMTEHLLLSKLVPMFLDPLPAKPILFRNCDAGPRHSFCSDATKRTMGGHTMTLLSPSTWENLQTTDDFWWSLDFRALFEAQDVWDEQKPHTGTMTHRKRGNYLHSMRWKTIRKCCL